MKHLFHIHSNINLICTLAIIEEKRIAEDDVILCVARGVNVSFLRYTVLSIPNIIYYHPFNAIRKLFKFKWLKNKDFIKVLDELVKYYTNSNPYIYYAPNSRSQIYKIFITNKKCCGVDYLEDGMDAYLQEEYYYRKYPLNIQPLKKIIQSKFFDKISIFKNKRLKEEDDPFKSYNNHKPMIYCISKNAYKFRENQTHVLSLVTISERFKSTKSLNDYDRIFILDAVVNQGVIPAKVFKQFFIDFLDTYDHDNLKIKFHPFQEKNIKKWIIETIMKKGLSVEIFDDEIPFELVLVQTKSLFIYGIGSSLLIYGKILGNHNVFPLYPNFLHKYNYQSSRHEFWESSFKMIEDL